MTARVAQADERPDLLVPRRAVLRGAAAVGAAGLLAACGSPGPGGTNAGNAGQSPAGSRSTQPPAPPAPVETTTPPPLGPIRTADIPMGGGVIYPDQRVVVTQPTAGVFKAFDATCTHAGCIVGSISGGKITCPCHGSQYRVADGSVARGPTEAPLPMKTVTVKGSIITVS